MALFHFHVGQVKRSAGQSAVASAAYRAGEKLYSRYYGESSDYTHKSGVVCSEILLPPRAPPEYKDRETLWNAVEEVERGKKAQLAYSFDISLQNELTMDENIELARAFLNEQFVSRGMIVDFAVHAPDKDGGIQNPHFHVMCPIRPLDENGAWGQKQRREYRLDENGNRITGADGKPLFDAVPTTDWGASETLEHWREEWARMINDRFNAKGLTCRIDHRSYQRQGIEQIPTTHEGPAVRQMERDGLTTDKGERNRWIKNTNKLMKELRGKIAALCDWIKEIKKELSQPRSPNLVELLNDYYADRNSNAWSQKARSNNLKQYSDIFNYLLSHKLFTVENLETSIHSVADKVSELQAGIRKMENRKHELGELINLAETYKELKPVFDEMNAIKWKGRKEKFKAEHDADLKRFYMARRKLKDHLSPAGKFPVAEWRRELAQLQETHDKEYAGYKSVKEEYKKLWDIKRCVDSVLRRQQREQTQIKKRENER